MAGGEHFSPSPSVLGILNFSPPSSSSQSSDFLGRVRFKGADKNLGREGEEVCTFLLLAAKVNDGIPSPLYVDGVGATFFPVPD